MTCLRQLGYLADHDSKQGGHVDLTVSHFIKPWKWLGEAKHFNNVGNLREGFLQLTTRYSNASPNENQGGVLAYLKRAKAKQQMDKWREEIKTLGLENLVFEECQNRPGIAFFSTHEHETSGMPYRVRHMCVMLHFDPQDKSGLSRAANRKPP
jgi:hypothetical protein